jgi:hypothetical protein
MRPLPILAVLVLAGCGSTRGTATDSRDVPADSPTSDAVADTESFAPVAIPAETSPAFETRRKEYLDACVASAGPGQPGGLYAQVCRVASGQPVEPAVLEAACTKVDSRLDTSDFSVAALVRILALDQKAPSLDPAVRARLEKTVLGFKYWLDEPGKDKMCFWSENHQILYHSNELVAGGLFPDTVFPNAGMTGKDHAAHAAPLADRWLGFRARFGFSEWHSNVYFNEDIPALVNLADFAPDPAMRARAAMILDVLALDLATNTFRGFFATAHGRTYPNKFLDGLKDSTADAAWVMLGLGQRGGTGDFSATFLSTSDGYRPPAILESVAISAKDRIEHRQRDGIDVVDGPANGIGYTDFRDINFWAGMAALVDPHVVDGTVAMLDAWDLWDGFLFGDLPAEVKTLLQGLAQTGQLQDFATQIEPISRGMALEAMNTYTWRTPDYQLSGAQDYHAGLWGTQTQIWQATLDGDAFVFTTLPSEISGVGEDVELGGDWIGGWQPRATFFRNVGVIQYRKPAVPAADEYLKSTKTHAFFPRKRFDEVRESGNWLFGRKGNAYVALYSAVPAAWAEGSDLEWFSQGTANVYVVELGSLSESGSFDAFAAAVEKAGIVAGDPVRYESPSVGTVEVGWTGPMTVAGKAVDLGPFRRWDGPYAHQEPGSTLLVVETWNRRLELDFDKPESRLFELTLAL